MKLYKIEELKLYNRGKMKGEITPHQRVLLKCDECEVEFLRVYPACKDTEFHRCKSCSTSHYNKTRDPEVTKRFRAARVDGARGKTIEEYYGKAKADEIRLGMSIRNSGEGNPNHGGKYSRGFADRPLFGPIEDRYGKDKADKMKAKASENFSGKNNPMYGKPSPYGAGNGLSGWYNSTYYFRSLLELFVIIGFENSGTKFLIGESNKIRYEYEFEGKLQTYSPDFYLPDTNEIIECKAKWNTTTALTIAKTNSVTDRKISYLTEDDIQVDYEKLVLLVKSGNVIIDKGKLNRMEKFMVKYGSKECI